MRYILFIFAYFFIALDLFAKEYKDVKYVFLFIGDGMSIPQRMMTDEYLKSQNKPLLSINQMPYHAITTTRSANSFITDSAASGTAIACGEKVPNAYIGINAKQKELTSVADVAKKNGYKVGIITSVPINHATPAAFYGHSSARSNYYKIGLDLIESDFDFYGGGMPKKVDDKKSPSYKGNLLELAKKAGYKLALKRAEVEALSANDKKVIAIPYDRENLPYFIDEPDSMRISHLLEKSIEILDNGNGFFIMVEGGKIDWLCHANDATSTIKEVIDMDNAVKVALDFAKKHPNETLIIVTGDHETGGLTLGFAGTGYTSHYSILADQKCSQEVFEYRIRRFFKENPDAEFKDIQNLITENFGLLFNHKGKKNRMSLNVLEEKQLLKAFKCEKKGFEKKSLGKEAYESEKSPLSLAVLRILNNKAGIAWTSDAHTALPIQTSATGINAESFNGMIDNTDISRILKDILN